MAKFPSYHFGFSQALLMVAGSLAALALPLSYALYSVYTGQEDPMYKDWFIVLISVLQFLGAILAFDFLYCRPKFRQSFNVDITGRNFSTFFLSMTLLLGTMFVAEAITSAIPTTGDYFAENFKKYEETFGRLLKDIPTSILLVVVFAPVLEEIVFRGIVLKGLLNKGMAPTKAIILSAVLFGVVHGNIWQFLGAFLIALSLGFVYLKTKTLLLPILMHAFNNGTALLLYYTTKKESIADFLSISEWFVFFAGLVVVAVTLHFFILKLKIIHQEA